MNEIPRGIGDNFPPQTLADELSVIHGDDLTEASTLVAAAEQAPERVDDDDTQNKFAEMIKKLRALELKFDHAREDLKGPLEEKVKQINGFFKTHMARLEKIRLILKTRSTDYLDRKAEAERRRLKEEEDRKREAAAKALALAKEAEESKTAAAAALSDARRLVEDAQDAKRAAITEQEIAAADVAEARAVYGAIKAEMLQVAADFAKCARDGAPAGDDEKASMWAGFEERLAATKARVETAEAALKAARLRAAVARAEQQRRDDEAREAAKVVKAADREADKSLSDAVRETKGADKLAAKAGGSDADLARTRSLHGAVSTLSRRWTSRVVNRDLLDKSAIWPHINGEALDAALWKWMMNQPADKRVMPGAIMQEETIGEIR